MSTEEPDISTTDFGKKKKKKKVVVITEEEDKVDGSVENAENGEEVDFSKIKKTKKKKIKTADDLAVNGSEQSTADEYPDYTYDEAVPLARLFSLKRTPKHLLAFLLAEMGTSGSIDGNNQLIIKGRFQQKHVENVLRKYIKEYVTCHTCKSPETLLQKDTRLFFLQCEDCGSRCSVASIKTGFQAVTTKRARTRIAAAAIGTVTK